MQGEEDDDLGNLILEDPEMIRQQQFILDQMGEEEEVDVESDEDQPQ